jgi:hypothetical protein
VFEVLQHQRDRRECPYRSSRKQRIRIPISEKTMSSTESYFGLRTIDSLFHRKHNMQCLKYSSINEIVENALTVRLGNSEDEFRFPEKRCQPPDRISDYEQSIRYFIGNAITTLHTLPVRLSYFIRYDYVLHSRFRFRLPGTS